MFDLTGKTALVTGASGGIGGAIAKALHAQGATVVLSGTRQDALDAVKAELGSRAFTVIANLSDAASVEALPKKAEEAAGAPIDILVNNAGITRDNLFVQLRDEDWDEVIKVNLTATFRLARAATKLMMRKRFGRIIAITSIVGVTGNPGQGNYSASKAGLIGMTLSLANAMPASGFTANVIAPLAATRMAATGMGVEGSDEQLDEAARVQLAGLDLDPDAVVPLVAFLLSDAAEVMTGQVFTNRGWSYTLLSHPEPLEQVDACSRELFTALADLQAAFGAVTPAASRWGARAQP